MRLSSDENGCPQRLLLSLGDQLDLHARVLRQRLHGEGGAGGEGSLEELSIHLVHLGKVGHVGHENRRLDYVGHRQALGGKDSLGVVEALAGELLDAALSEVARGGVDGELTTDEHYVAGTNGLAVRADGCGSHV